MQQNSRSLRKMGQFRVWAVFLTVAFASHIALSKRSYSEDFGFFDCLMCQFCICGNFSLLRDCWYKAMEETRQKLLDNINVCKLSNTVLDLDMNQLELVTEICNFPLEEWKECYKNGEPGFRDYMIDVSIDPFRKDVSIALENARVCISPAIVSCQVYGTDTC